MDTSNLSSDGFQIFLTSTATQHIVAGQKLDGIMLPEEEQCNTRSFGLILWEYSGKLAFAFNVTLKSGNHDAILTSQTGRHQKDC
jgi:hypothetical protein